MNTKILSTILLIALFVFLSEWRPVAAQQQEVEIDAGVFVPVPEEAAPLQAEGVGTHFTGLNVGVDVTHNIGGRQDDVTFAYLTMFNDFTAHGATVTFVNTGPLTLSLLNQHDVWWIEEDLDSTFSDAEKDDLIAYVQNGGCIIFNGDEHGTRTAEPGAIIALFDIPYAFLLGRSGFTSNIAPHFITDAFPSSGFPAAIAELYAPGPENILDPMGSAFDIIKDKELNPIVAVNTLGAGGVVVLGDEMTTNSGFASPIFIADNRTLASRVFEFCAFGLGSQVSQVTIDIKPGDDPNCFNNDGHGIIPVAILSDLGFDATQIDPSTLSLDGQAVRVVGKKATCRYMWTT